jgi:hypothetical protein
MSSPWGEETGEGGREHKSIGTERDCVCKTSRSAGDGWKTCASGYVGKAALKTPAVQTLCEVGSRVAVAKLLECDGFSIAFGRAESP